MRITVLLTLSSVLLFSSACVSKKKYLAASSAGDSLALANTQQQKQNDSLLHVLVLKNDTIHMLDSMLALERDRLAAGKIAPAPPPKKSNMSSSEEYEKKALFVFNFTRYVAWPPAATIGDKFVIGVVGDSPLYNKLVEKTDGKKALGKPIVIKQVNASTAGVCQLVFISHSQIGNLASIKKSLSKSTLIITEEGWGLYNNSHINLYPDDMKVRYSVNKALLEKNDLKATQDLLRYADN